MSKNALTPAVTNNDGDRLQKIAGKNQVVPLTEKEAQQLAECERTIEKELQGYIERGTSFATIRDKKLHRKTHPTWKAYCADRWHLSKTHADRLILAAKVGKLLLKMSIVAKGEWELRPLVGLTDAQLESAIAKARKAAAKKRQALTAKLIAKHAPRLKNEVSHRRPRHVVFAMPPALKVKIADGVEKLGQSIQDILRDEMEDPEMEKLLEKVLTFFGKLQKEAV